MAGKLHENEMKEGQAGEKAQEKTGKKAGIFSRLKPALAALAITVGCGTYENEGIPAVSTDGTGGMSVDGGTTTDGGEEEDGGETGGDGGTGGKDAGTGGHDAGSGGHDAGTGGLDAGTGGMDSGTGGMDSGTGGMDSGTGGLDAGTGGMDSGTGGMDSGTGGSDGGSGGDAGVSCMGLGTGNFSGLIANGAGQAVGGYTFTYLGPSGGQAMLDISCSGGVLFNDYLFPEDMVTNVIDMPNGKQFNITPHSVGAGSTNITIQVANWP